jgi:hypothetical protein
MRTLHGLSAVLLLVAIPTYAQEWKTYTSRVDGFEANFPGEPTTTAITWPSEYGVVFPGRVYSLASGANRYSVTVIDYRDSERLHAQRTNRTEAENAWTFSQMDIQAAIAYAATSFRQRQGVTVTYDAWHHIDRVSGHQLQLTNADQSRTFAAIYMYENRLYILEATVPPRAPAPGLFQQSLQFLDDAGERVRFDVIYNNRLPPQRLGGRRNQQAP